LANRSRNFQNVEGGNNNDDQAHYLDISRNSYPGASPAAMKDDGFQYPNLIDQGQLREVRCLFPDLILHLLRHEVHMLTFED